MIDLLSYSAPIITVGAIAGLLYDNVAAALSCQALFVAGRAIRYGVAAMLRRRRRG